jgi:phosphatidylinositol 4-kinase
MMLELLRNMWIVGVRGKNEDFIVVQLHEIQTFLKSGKAGYDLVEFYLLEIMHVILHTENPSAYLSDAYLHFVGVLSASSLHYALIVSHMLAAALEDFMPELPSGKSNPRFDKTLYLLIGKMVNVVQHSIISEGRADGLDAADLDVDELLAEHAPHVEVDFQNAIDTGVSLEDVEFTDFRDTISEEDKKLLQRRASRRNSLEAMRDSPGNIVQANKTLDLKIPLRRPSIINTSVTLLEEEQKARAPPSTMLKFKRAKRKSFMSVRTWIPRSFVVENGLLCCYSDEKKKKLKRAISLQGCTVSKIIQPGVSYTFCVEQSSFGVKFNLQADDEEQLDQWIAYIQQESHGVVGINTNNTSNHGGVCDTIVDRDDDDDEENWAKSKQVVAEDEGDRLSVTRPTSEVKVVKRASLVRTSTGVLAGSSFFSARTINLSLLNLGDKRSFLRTKATSAALVKSEEGDDAIVSDVVLSDSNAFWERSAQWLEACKDSLSDSALEAFDVFSGIRSFTTELCRVCEEMRFVDRDKRKQNLKLLAPGICGGFIPPVAYFMTLSGCDNYFNILRIFDKECYPFSTRERCPCLFWFEVEGTGDEDVIGHLGKFSGGSNAKSRQSIGNGTVKDDQTPAFGVSYETNIPIIDKEYADSIFGESFQDKEVRLLGDRRGGENGRALAGLIAKSNDDVRQEVFVIQLIALFQDFCRRENVPVWLRSYRVVSTSKTTGLIALLSDSTSLDGLKGGDRYPGSMSAHFEAMYGNKSLEPGQNPTVGPLHDAKMEFVRSMAGYSIMSYLLGIKDRHNGNIMIDRQGHIIHIDFGFVFGLAPGNRFSMETAPWKLTKEMVDVMDGQSSAYFAEYRRLCCESFKVARKHSAHFLILLDMMHFKSEFPAFLYNAKAHKQMRKKFMLKLADDKIDDEVHKLIASAYNHSGTNAYDVFQSYSNKIRQ